jgi:phage terminase small subunit
VRKSIKVTTLSPFRQRFVREYLVDLNGAKAYRRAGGAEKAASAAASRLLKVVKVKKAIAKIQKEQAKRVEITAERVLKELAICAFSDLANHLAINPDTGAIMARGFKDMPGESRRALKSIKEDRVIKEDADGTKVTVYDKVRFELHDKLKALELLGRHLGMFNEEAKALGEVLYKLSEKYMPKIT